MQVVGGNGWVVNGNSVEEPVPQSTGVDEHVVLVHQRDLVPTPGGTLERVADHAFHPVRGVDADFGRDLLRGADAHPTAIAAVQALGSFTYHHEVHVLAPDHRLGERCGYAGIQPTRPQIHI